MGFRTHTPTLFPSPMKTGSHSRLPVSKSFPMMSRRTKNLGMYFVYGTRKLMLEVNGFNAPEVGCIQAQVRYVWPWIIQFYWSYRVLRIVLELIVFQLIFLLPFAIGRIFQIVLRPEELSMIKFIIANFLGRRGGKSSGWRIDCAASTANAPAVWCDWNPCCIWYGLSL